MRDIKISVIIPAYNVEKYIEEALNSVLYQTKDFFEVIVVNDGSYDGTTEIINEYVNVKRLSFININNSGPGHARNVGASVATGDYIYFFDSDDMLDRNFVEIISDKIMTNDFPDAIFFSGKCFFESGFDTSFSPDYSRHFEVSNVSGEEALARFYNTGKLSASPCLYIINRNFWTTNNLSFSIFSYEDEEMIFPLLLAANRVCVYDKVFFYRRVRPGSIMTSGISKEKTHGYFIIIESLVKIYTMHSKALPFTKKIILKRAGAFIVKYVEMSKALGLKINFLAIFMCSVKVKHPSLFLRALYGVQNDITRRLIRVVMLKTVAPLK